MDKKILIGLRLFSVTYIVSGVIICGLLTGLLFLAIIMSQYPGSAWPELYSVLFFLFSLMMVVSNIAMLSLKEWGRKSHLFFVWLFTFIIASYSFAIFKNSLSSDYSAQHAISYIAGFILLFSLIMCVSSTIYLTRSKVKEHFKK